MRVTFLRSRPAESLAEPTARARRREGTTAIEIEAPTKADLAAGAAAGVMVVSSTPSVAEAAGWVVPPDLAGDLEKAGAAPWRVTILDQGPMESVLDALARTRAAYLRTGRSDVARAYRMASLPGIGTSVSVFVDDIEQAISAVAEGATDLVLRDWSVDWIGELREALDVQLVERTALPPGVVIDEARSVLPAPVFTTWLGLTDGSGAARPRYEWAPGRDVHPPVPDRRLSAEWPDAVWVGGRSPRGLEAAGDLRPTLEAALAGTPPTTEETVALFEARGDQVDSVAHVADRLRRQTVGDTVTYVVNRNINYTNLCYFKCGFCAFSKGPKSLNLRGDPYLMGVEEIVDKAREAWDRGASEVTLQGGIHPDFTGNFYMEVVKAIKDELPGMHIHGFTPLEVWQGAETLGIPVAQFLTELRDAGLGSLPGTAAEILDDRIRLHLCPDKIRTAQWAEVMITAHGLGLGSTATIMFGHIDDPRSWANHLEVIRRIQTMTGGFTELVPLPFVHMGSPIYLRGRSRPGPTWDEVVLVHAVSRIALHGLVPNIQASWVKLGLDGGARLLDAGCNDLGGTLMGEIITRSAGAAHGEEVTPSEFRETIIAAGRTPALRNTVYEILEPADL
jgi:FO synthase